MREFLHVDDLAEACLFLMLNYNKESHVNVGTGEDISINDLAELIKRITGYKGGLRFNTSRPDGTPRKLLDVSKIHEAGWRHTINLEQGIIMVVKELAASNFSSMRLVRIKTLKSRQNIQSAESIASFALVVCIS